MRKTFNINIAGIPFVIDEDAYALLNNYINTIQHAFRNVDGGSELLNDIESRIAELLMQASEQGSPIITLADVQQVIERVGNPEEFVDEETITEEDSDSDATTVTVETENATPPPYIPNLPHTSKRLYRDPQSAILGGVCSGLAWYLGWDVTWVRLLMVLLTIISYGAFALAYVLLWVIVPAARTPLQRMQMMGEQPTMENIAKTVTDNFKEAEESGINRQSAPNPYSEEILSNGTTVLAKALAVIGIPFLLVFALVTIGCVIFLLAWASAVIFGSGMPWQQFPEVDPWLSKLVFWGVLCAISWSLLFGIPLLYFVRKGFNFTPFSKQTKRICNYIWGLCIVMAGVSTGMVISYTMSHEKFMNEQYKRNRRAQREEEENYKKGIMNLSVEEIQAQIDDLNNQVDQLQKDADSLQEEADSLCDKAKEMKALSEHRPNKEQYKRMAKKYERQSKAAKKKSETLLKQAHRLTEKSLNISDILIEKQTNAIDAKIKEVNDSLAN